MDAATYEAPAQTSTAPNLTLLFVSLAGTVGVADFCLWRSRPRLSVGLFVIGLAAIILLNRRPIRWSRNVICLTVLLCGAAIGSAIDFCYSNVLMLVVLTLALTGESYYHALRPGWSRCSEALWTMAKTPIRWIMLLIEVAARVRVDSPRRSNTVRKAARILWIAVPGIVASGFFGLVLCSGNPLFAKFMNDWTRAIQEWILKLDLDFFRFAMWAFVAGLALPLLWPSPPPKKDRIWTREAPLLPELISPQMARLQSVVMLGLLNALFCCVNTIDVVYLWVGQKLPAGIKPSVFVHHGVSSLIMAVIFSAVLLAGIFQQVSAVSRWTPLRLLGLVWIAQNLVLLAGVFLRVKLYLDTFNLTLTRVNLVFFLLLVATGFVLLAIHVWQGRTLGWLLRSNVIATFFLFYGVQFLDTQGFVANYNVRLWQDCHGRRDVDLAYLKSLGPPAWEALRQVAASGEPNLSKEAKSYLYCIRQGAQQCRVPWGSWQLRDIRCQRRLLDETEP